MPAAPSVAQRRQLTILFCDLVGSTRLSIELDPEDMQDLIRGFLECCREQIEAAGGYVAKYMGDGLLAYFGFPNSNEDDAARAVQAALTIAVAVGRLPGPDGRTLAVRSGIATGIAVVGEALGSGAAAELAVVGDIPNLAARLQALGAPNQVVISDRTRELTAGLFEVERMPPAPLKGFDADNISWRVTGASEVPSRFGQRRDRGLTAFIGRTAERGQILETWQRAAAGSGGVIGVIGPAGVGKSRLVHEVQRQIARGPHIFITGSGVRIFTSSPFHVIAQMLRRRLRIRGGDPIAGLEAMLHQAAIDFDPALPLLAELLGLAMPDAVAPLAMRADMRRGLLIETLMTLLDTSTSQWPTLIVVEDLHWLDPSSLDLLARLAELAPARRLLILFTVRDDQADVARALPNMRHLPVARLNADEMRDLIGEVALQLPADTVSRVIARSDGIPLFAEELAALIATQNGQSGDALIPATLSDLLMARLGGLGKALPLAQTAAVLGAECNIDLLAQVTNSSVDEIDAAITRMVTTGLVERHRTKIVFRHTLLREAAYEALPRRDRRRLHGRAASTITAGFPGLILAQPDVVAHHLTEAGGADAVPAWLDAGRGMADRSAYVEAARAFDRALGLLDRVPADARVAAELQLQTALAGVTQITDGYSAERPVGAIKRARELAELSGDIGRQFALAAGQWSAASSAGDYAAAGPLASKVLRLARVHELPDGLGVAHMIALTSRYRVGNLMGAEEAFDRGRSYFDRPVFTDRPGAVEQTFGNAAIVAWLIGDHDEARRRLHPLLTLADGSEMPYRRAMAAFMAALALAVSGAFDEARRWALVAADISNEHGFPQYTIGARIIRGRAEAGLGQPEAGAALLRDGVNAIAGTRLGAAITLYLTWLAEVEQMIGDTVSARAVIERALTVNQLERFYRPESLRVRATLAFAAGNQPAALADAAEAVTMTRNMGARALHARALAAQRYILHNGNTARVSRAF